MNATTNKDGIDPAAVVMVARAPRPAPRAPRQAAPVRELLEDEAIEFAHLATRIENEAAGGSPDRGRLQRWGREAPSLASSTPWSSVKPWEARLLRITGWCFPGVPQSDRLAERLRAAGSSAWPGPDCSAIALPACPAPLSTSEHRGSSGPRRTHGPPKAVRWILWF